MSTSSFYRYPGKDLKESAKIYEEHRKQKILDEIYLSAAILKERGLTYKEVGKLLGVSSSTAKKYYLKGIDTYNEKRRI